MAREGLACDCGIQVQGDLQRMRIVRPVMSPTCWEVVVLVFCLTGRASIAGGMRSVIGSEEDDDDRRKGGKFDIL